WPCWPAEGRGVQGAGGDLRQQPARRGQGPTGPWSSSEPGAQSSTLKQSADPGETVICGPEVCGCCGADLAGATVIGMQTEENHHRCRRGGLAGGPAEPGLPCSPAGQSRRGEGSGLKLTTRPPAPQGRLRRRCAAQCRGVKGLAGLSRIYGGGLRGYVSLPVRGRKA